MYTRQRLKISTLEKCVWKTTFSLLPRLVVVAFKLTVPREVTKRYLALLEMELHICCPLIGFRDVDEQFI
jgi:hypothetical protein